MAGLDLKNETVFEVEIMQHFGLTMIESDEPNKSYSQSNLDRLEGDFQKKLMTMNYHGGIHMKMAWFLHCNEVNFCQAQLSPSWWA